MTQFLNDDFTGPDGTALSAYSPLWVGASGAVQLFGYRARQSGSTTAVFCRSDSLAPSSDYDVSANLYIANSGGAPSVGVCGRMAGPGAAPLTFYQARIVNGSGIILARFLNGTAVSLATYAYTSVFGTEPKLTLRMRGDQLSVLLDDVLVIGPITDANIPGPGYVGLRMASASVSQIHIDNLSASTFDAETVTTTTTVSPAPAALTATGYAPSVSQTANQVVVPGPAALTIAGYAPAITQTSARAISPAPASLRVTGYAPIVTHTWTQAVTPGPAALVVTGYPPAITRMGTQSVSPAPAALTVRGYAPRITQAANNVPNVYATTGMRTSVTSKTALITARISRSAPMTAVGVSDAVILTQRSLSRVTNLDRDVLNRTVSIP